MSKLNSKLFKNKMTESKKSTEDIPGFFAQKVEVNLWKLIFEIYLLINFRPFQMACLRRNCLQVNILVFTGKKKLRF